MNYKTNFLNQLQEENRNFEALLAQIGEANLDKAGVTEDWSVKDVIAHLTEWRKRNVDRLQAARRNEKVKPPQWPIHLKTNEDINAWIYETNHTKSVAEVLNESRQTFQEMVAAVDAFSDEELADPQQFEWADDKALTAEMLFGHYHDEHEADLRKWAEKKVD
jgi:hypothetical protein